MYCHIFVSYILQMTVIGFVISFLICFSQIPCFTIPKFSEFFMINFQFLGSVFHLWQSFSIVYFQVFSFLAKFLSQNVLNAFFRWNGNQSLFCNWVCIEIGNMQELVFTYFLFLTYFQWLWLVLQSSFSCVFQKKKKKKRNKKRFCFIVPKSVWFFMITF